MSQKDKVVLNVGGTTFITTTSTLRTFGTETTLGALTLQTFTDEPVFIDRDPELFRHILNCMRNRNVLGADELNVPAKLWDWELAYFGLRESTLSDVIKEIKKKKMNTSDMVEKLLLWLITRTCNGNYTIDFNPNTAFGEIGSLFVICNKDLISRVAKENGIYISINTKSGPAGFGTIRVDL